MIRRGGLLGLAFCVLGPTAPAGAQDVELLGEIHGTRPPEGYFRQLQADPRSFRFELEGIERMRELQGAGARSVRPAGSTGPAGPSGSITGPSSATAPSGPATLLDEPLAGAMGPRGEPIVGTFRFPLVLGTFSDGPASPPFTSARIQEEFFDGPNSHFQTIPELYAEMSGGLVQLEGVTFDWVQTGLTAQEVTQDQSGLVSHPTLGVGAFIERIVQALDDAGVDWSQFDGAGDGFVDVLTVMHPFQGAECAGGGTNRIWSHRWNLNSATQGRLSGGFRTSTPRPDGQGFIYINDYTVQPAVACNAEEINQIGVFAHELGHGFGLPDLYATGGMSHRGAGNWDLMGTGSWGCDGTDPARPCHMGAWTKAMLGWIGIEEIGPGADRLVTLEPVVTGNRAVRIPTLEGSREYLLIENRQRLGSDAHLFEPGLLIWHIDEAVVDFLWPFNAVNSDPNRMGVWLRQADGLNQLAQPSGSRGDRGDPFPGCIKGSLEEYLNPDIPCGTNTAFHMGHAPLSLAHSGAPLGITLTGIELVGSAPQDVRFRVRTGYSSVTLLAEEVGAPEAPAGVAGFQVDGSGLEGPHTFLSAPFQAHQLVAPGGLSLGEGSRVSFREWADGAPRSRSFVTPLSDTTLVARYEGREHLLSLSMNEPVEGVSPGIVTAEPDGEEFWFPEGITVSLEATARRGFAFREWTGALTGTANPASLNVQGPAELHVLFDLTYGFAAGIETVEISAASPREIVLEVRDGNEPVTWSLEAGALPDGLELRPEEGTIVGAAMEMGTFPLEIRARDGIGLEASASMLLEVGRPDVGVEQLVGPFLGTGAAPTQLQQDFLDRHGNVDGGYDLGDFRAFLLAHPTLPMTAAERQLTRMVVPLGSFEGLQEGGAEEANEDG